MEEANQNEGKHETSISLDENDIESMKSASLNVSSPANKSSNVEDSKEESSGHKRSHTVPDVDFGTTRETVELPQSARKAESSRGFIDTAAPFDSVKQAVNKFGGIVGRFQQSLAFEKQKGVETEIRKLNDEVAKHKREFESALVAKGEVLKELDDTKKLVEELKITLEKSDVQESHAKEDSVLAELRLKELENGIDAKESTAIKRQIGVNKERYKTAIAELNSAKKELEALRQQYDSISKIIDLNIGNTEGSVSAEEDIKRTAELITKELVETKIMLEASQTALLNAEESRVNASMAYEQEKLSWEQELKQAESEAEQLSEQLNSTNDLKLKLETACALLSSLKTELTSYVETKLNEEESNGDDDTQRKNRELIRKRKELEEIKAEIEKARNDVNCLRIAATSLSSELEKEKESLAAIKNSEGNVTQSVSTLEAELEKINAELDLIQTKEREVREKMTELPKQLGEATREAEEAKAIANSAREELRRAKEENEHAKAMTIVVEKRLKAAMMEIEAANASTKLATSAYRALEESENAPEDSSKVVTIPVEEYYQLSKRAHEAEEIANKRIISAIEEIKAVKESESQSLVKLEEANKIMIERKEGLKTTTEKAQRDKEKEMEAVAGDEAETLADHSSNHERKNSATEDDDNASETSSTSSPKHLELTNSTGTGSEKSKKKGSFFPRLLGKKKSHSVKQ